MQSEAKIINMNENIYFWKYNKTLVAAYSDKHQFPHENCIAGFGDLIPESEGHDMMNYLATVSYWCVCFAMYSTTKH